MPQQYVQKQTDQEKLKMNSQESAEAYTSQVRRRFVKGFLDILILRLLQAKPTWGYDIIKATESMYNFKLRHGALYPMLNQLEKQGLVKSRRELKKGRMRKVYEITQTGRLVLQSSQDFLKQQTTPYDVKKQKREQDEKKKGDS